MDFLYWIESLGISTFIRESNSLLAFPGFLFIHTLGVSMVAGGSAIVAFALLGLWPQTSLKPLERLYGFIWLGFGINLATGVGLILADASTKGINPVFWVKMVFVIGGVTLMLKIRRQVFHAPQVDAGSLPDGTRTLAWASLGCWFFAIVCGRLIAYVGPVVGS